VFSSLIRDFFVNFFANLGGALVGVWLAFWLDRLRARRESKGGTDVFYVAAGSSWAISAHTSRAI